VGVDGFASDGALHVEPTSKEAEFTNDITRHKQAIVFEDPHIYTGDTVSGATDHLVGYWKCDDNAASTTIVASVGSNGTLQGRG
jgi:pyrimidine operon attenuation protein/uracil phosphoribosyltransferase